MNEQTTQTASKKMTILVIVILAIVALSAAFFAFQATAPAEVPETASTQYEYPEGLEAEVFKTVDAKTAGVWDKRLSLDLVDDDKTTAKGKWYANDAWTWIGWQEADGNWKVLVNIDGFDCVELSDVPEEHVDFFHDVTHFPDGKAFCYDHTQ
jgi:hypothetical protein